MASNKEQTLTIRDVMGISRYYSSTNTPPNKPKTLQNLYSPRRGELALIPGVAELANTIPLLDEIQDVTYLEQIFGDQAFMVFYTTTGSITPPPTSGANQPTFTPPTGAPTGTRDIFIEYVYPGGSTQYSTYSAKAYGTSGSETYTDVTIPTSVPSSVYSINFYVLDSSGSLVTWAGSISRKNGVFPTGAEATIRLYVTHSTPTGSNRAIGGAAPAGLTVTPTTVAGGELTPGRVYFFGICPYLTQLTDYFRLNRVALYDSAYSPTSNPGVPATFSGFLPEGYNAFTLQFTGVPTSTGADVATQVDYYQVFAGQTPEDLAPIGDDKVHQALPKKRSTTTITYTFKSLPYNTNQAMSMATYDIATANPVPQGVSIAGRVYGSWFYQSGWPTNPVFPVNKTRSNALASIQFPYSATSHKEMLPGVQWNFNQTQNFSSLTSKNVDTTSINKYGFSFSFGNIPRSDVYQDRVYYADGYQSYYKTNGHLVAPVFVDDLTRVPPITNNIILFKDRICLLGGSTNWSYDKGNILYSDSANPNSFGSGAGNFLNVNFGDASDIVGAGVYSRDLSNTGPATFLVVGKKGSTYSWNGGVTAADQSLVQISKAVGWLSANSFALTQEGAVVATNQGLYGITGADMQPINPDTQIFYQDLTPAQQPYTNVIFNGDRLIVGFNNGATELWYDFRRDPDGLVVVPTGPHVMKPYAGQAVALNYGTLKNYRVSFNAGLGNEGKFYRRDVPDLYTNDGADIPWMIEFNETGLGADEFVKILTRMYIRAKILQEETVTISMPSYDSSSDGQGLDYDGTGLQTVSEQLIMPYDNTLPADTLIYRLFQKVFSSRYRGAIFVPKFSGATDKDFRIVSISLLYELKRRRLL